MWPRSVCPTSIPVKHQVSTEEVFYILIRLISVRKTSIHNFEVIVINVGTFIMIVIVTVLTAV